MIELGRLSVNCQMVFSKPYHDKVLLPTNSLERTAGAALFAGDGPRMGIIKIKPRIERGG